MNVLLILTDQQSHTALSCTGNPYVDTPNMDALAASGARFTRSYCAAPVCGPSRACLATGRMPHENGVLVNGSSVLPDVPTVGEIFREAGYRTAWTGRWCVPGDGPDIPGFDCLHETDRPLGRGIYADGHVADRAVEFLSRDHDGPFLLGVSLCNPHDICYWIMQQSTPAGDLNPHTIGLKRQADAIDFGFTGDRDLPPLPDNFDMDPDEPEFITRCRTRPYYGQENIFTWDWDEETWRRYLDAYYRLTESVDERVGRVLSALHESGMADDTLVVFTSDHGEGMAAHRWVVKLSFYEEAARVPLVCSLPGAIPSEVVDTAHLTSGIDVLPTLCDYAGVPCPDVTGVSLRGAIEHPGRAGRAFVVSELHPDPKNLDAQGRMVRTHRYKYVVFSEGRNPEQLFDLDRDPGEKANLAADPAAESVLSDHRELLARWCREHADDFTPAVV